MAEGARVQLKIRVVRVGLNPRSETDGAAADFWSPLIDEAKLSNRSRGPLIESLEKRLKPALSRNLKAELAGYFGGGEDRKDSSPSAGGSPARYATLIPLVGLEITSISYGSLDLALEFTGVKHLVELFDANFDLL